MNLNACTTTCSNEPIGSGTRNVCGGCSALAHAVGEYCGSGASADCKSSSTWQCDNADSMSCRLHLAQSGEICDGQDNDCDGDIDESDDHAPGGICSFGF